jgi:SDR family mycofactocin-dependent oxidoreductase
MGKGLEGKVAFVTGAARGQGRAHCVRLAREGVDIIGVDICEDIDTMTYSNARWEDLQETQRLVEAQDRRMVIKKADVRDYQVLKTAFDEAYAELGRLDIIVANAGIVRMSQEEDLVQEWRDVLDTNLSGVYYTLRVATDRIREGGRGGSIIMTSSTAGLRATAGIGAAGNAYAASKRALVALCQSFALELAPERIRVNTVHPTAVNSGMTDNDAMRAIIEYARQGGKTAIAGMENALPFDMLEPEDIANAVAFLVSDEAWFITGVNFPLDGGFALSPDRDVTYREPVYPRRED